MTRQLAYFIGGVFLGLAVLSGAYYLTNGTYGAACVAAAGAICGIPTLGSLALTIWSRDRAGAEQLMALFGGIIVRMGVVGAVSLAVFLTVPYFRESKDRELVYWSAILFCYLGTLAWETVLAARNQSQAAMTANESGGRP